MPLSSALWPGSESPFCALAVAVDLDDGGIDHGVFHVRLVGARFKNPSKNIGFHPVAVSLEDRVPFADAAADRARDCRCARSREPPQEKAGCRCRCGRDPSASPDNAAPSSPIGRLSVRIDPSKACITNQPPMESRTSTGLSAAVTHLDTSGTGSLPMSRQSFTPSQG